MSTVQFRSDVAAVGALNFDSDVFVIAGISSNDAYYHLMVYETSSNTYVFMEGAIGSLLTGGLPSGYQLHYFTAQQTRSVPYPESMIHVALLNWLDPAATQPVLPTPTGTSMPAASYVVPQISKTNVCTLTAATATTSTFRGVTFNSTDPIEYPSNGNLLVGYRYGFYGESITSGVTTYIVATIPVYKSQGQLGSDSQYGGLPFGLTSPPAQEGSSFSAVFLPLNWWLYDPTTQDCDAQVSSSNQFSNVIYSICDRYGALINTTDPFYVNNCTTMAAVRGNVRQTDCFISDGNMYYVPDGFSSNTFPTNVNTVQCGQAWNGTTRFRDMTETLIQNVSNPYGTCNLGLVGPAAVCTFSASGPTQGQATCVPLDTTPETDSDQPQCSQCNMSCTDCSVSNCQNDCTKCTIDPKSCPQTHTVPDWMWIVVAILGIVLLILIFVVLHHSSGGTKKGKNNKKYAQNDVNPGVVKETKVR